MQRSDLSRVAAAVGLPERYRYWSGHSRRRYLFSRALPASGADYEDAVVIAVRAGEVVWVGEPGAAVRCPEQTEDCALFVHLLATSAEERRRIIADLRPARRSLALAA